jgi:hypothetical protein
VAWHVTYGHHLSSFPLYDIENSKYIINFGRNNLEALQVGETRKFVKFFLTGSTLLNFGIGAEFNLTRWMFFSYRLTSSPLYYADNYIISRTSELGFRLSKRITVSTGITLPTIKRKNPIHKYDYEFFFPDLRIGYNF